MAAEADPGPPAPAFDDVPTAYIASDRRQALGRHADLPDRSSGSGLFADISGFVGVSESLAEEYGPQRGAEVLTAVINRAVGFVIQEVARYGGSVIYFSGDAVTCWFEADDGRRAATAALRAVSGMVTAGHFVTDAGAEVALGLKATVAVGSTYRFVVGRPEVQLIDVLAGHLLTELADTERLATRGEVVLGPSAVAALAGRARLGDRRPLPRPDDPDAQAAVLLGLDQLADPVPAAPVPELAEELVRPWLLPVVYERLRAGRGEFVAELRSALPVFIRFGGFDVDTDPDAPARLDTFVRLVQDIFTAHGGNVLQLTLGDKGAYLYAVFGSPHAHGDDPVRAAAAVLELRAAAARIGADDLQIGITYGRVRSGTYGDDQRRTFVCLGPPVNLAARLMADAPLGGIQVTADVIRAAPRGFDWSPAGTRQLKGREEPVEVWRLAGYSREATGAVGQGPLVGRVEELAVLEQALTAALTKAGSVVGITGGAGSGKSRLVSDATEPASGQGVLVVWGEPSVTNRRGSYAAWRQVLEGILDIDPDATVAVQSSELLAAVARFGERAAQLAPLLGPVMGFVIPDNALTTPMDAKLRKAARENLVISLIRSRCGSGPVAVVLEDVDRMDALSRDLLVTLARAAPDLGLTLLLTYRPLESPDAGLGLGRLPWFTEVTLDALSPTDTDALVMDTLRRTLGADCQPSSRYVDLIRERSQGNPFYVEQLVAWTATQGVDPADPRTATELDLPGSLHSLVLERIDSLHESPRRTIKVASVVGRRFHHLLVHAVYPELGTLSEALASLQAAATADLLAPDEDDQSPWRFSHNLVHEVAYQSVPFSIRSVVHGHVAARLEASNPHPTGTDLDLVTHHWWNSGNVEKQITYLGLAGDAAQARYANDSALEYFERLAGLTTGIDRAKALRHLGQVLELTGNWQDARDRMTEAAELAQPDPTLWAWCQVQLAELFRKQGQFAEAADRLSRAADAFSTVGDDAGRAQVEHYRGTLAAQQGDNPSARGHYLASLELRPAEGEELAKAATMSNLGVIAEYEGNLDQAWDSHQQAMELRTTAGDQWGMGVSNTNLGMIALLQHRPQVARDYFEEAMRLNAAVGDTWMVGISHNNLGNADRDLGDHTSALRHYADAGSVFLTNDDRWALAFLFEDAALCWAEQGDTASAAALLGAADACREQLGSPRPDALETELTGRIAGLVPDFGQPTWEEARRQGRNLDPAAAAALLRSAGDLATTT